MSETLFLSIHQQIEIAFDQILDVFAVFVSDDSVHLNKLCSDANHVLARTYPWRILRGFLRIFFARRLLRVSGSRNAAEQCDSKKKNDRSLISEHGLLIVLI